MQGFGAGVELVGTITFIEECMPVKRRGFSAIPNTVTNFSLLIATLTFLFFS
ncbi:hypothetical protein [Sodalis sp.]|uniref:hypothetical protein n=1 Tax=Sodalis sp. (in: enterobacteria) TaxID=1898979 RepID=UPI00387359D7